MYQGLGFDPTPGDLGAVTEAITQLTTAAEALAEVGSALRRAAEDTRAWHGPAADTFRARLLDTPHGLEERERDLRRAAAMLDRWADVLTANRSRAEELDSRALRLRGRLGDARDLLHDRQDARDLAGSAPAAAAADADLAAVSTLVTDLQSALDGVLAEARLLERDHLQAADALAGELAGGDIPVPGGEALGRTVSAALGMASRTSGALARLLLPTGRAEPVPAGAAGALAAAISSGEPR